MRAHMTTGNRREKVAKIYSVKLKVVSQKGTCVAGHKVGVKSG